MKLTTIVPEEIFIVEDFLSPEECHEYISLSEGIGYESASIQSFSGPVMRPDIRNNQRVILDDFELTEILWQKVKPYSPNLAGLPAIGLNERWRFYRYDVGEFFASHRDGSYSRENGDKSAYTLMIYLNEDFRGGETEFDLRYPYGEIGITPKTGRLILFAHSLRHEGKTVTRGRKYVLRTDVMYSG